MIQILNELVNNRTILMVGIWYGLPITFFLLTFLQKYQTVYP